MKAYGMRMQGTAGLVGYRLGAAEGDGEPRDSPNARRDSRESASPCAPGTFPSRCPCGRAGGEGCIHPHSIAWGPSPGPGEASRGYCNTNNE